MRQPIDTAPRDGDTVILEDSASGTYDVAHWSRDVGDWVNESGEAIKIAPSHWLPMPVEQFPLREDSDTGDHSRPRRTRRRLAIWTVAGTFAAAAGLYFQGELTAFTQQVLLAHSGATDSALPTPQLSPAIEEATAQPASRSDPHAVPSTREPPPFPANQQQAAVSTVQPAEAPGLGEEDRADSSRAMPATADQPLQLGHQPAVAFIKEAAVWQPAAPAGVDEQRRLLEQERDRTAELARQLAAARNDVAMQTALARKAADDLEQRRQTAENDIADLQRSLQQEKEKNAGLAKEADSARLALAASSEQQRREGREAMARAAALMSEVAGARNDAELRAAEARKASDEAVQQKRAADANIAELQEFLKQERERSAALAKQADAARNAMTARIEQQRREIEEGRARFAALASELAGARQELEARTTSSNANAEALRRKQAADSTISELQRALQQEREKTASLAREADAAREAATDAGSLRRSLEEARAQAAALSSELETARSELETQTAQAKASDEAGQAKERQISDLQRMLQQEGEKITALAKEADAARQALAINGGQNRRAIEEAGARAAQLASELAAARKEIETQAARAREAGNEAGQRKQAAEREIAELRQSLQRERDRTAAMVQDFETTRRAKEGRLPIGGTVAIQAAEKPVRPAQAGEAPVAEPSGAREIHEDLEAARLIARAGALIRQGNIGAARIVLERAAETGNATATFMLAETHDPAVLSAWGAFGTRGEVAKARELYAKAHAGGIQEAKHRYDALRR